MNASPSYVVRYKWCVLTVIAITLLSLMPQLRFWLVRGSRWQGAYTVLQLDEVLYSAYVNALIDGRPRRNDPTTGQDDRPGTPLPESLFSIQFIPPYVIAFLARAFGASASTAFIVLVGSVGLLASLAVFWLLASVTGDSKFAALGVLIVLCLGALAAGQGLIGLLLNLDVRFLGLPFLRSYEPSAAFPLFFVLCTLTWQALTTKLKGTATVSALLAGVTIGLLIFSYFYLWTAAIAWLSCVGCLWLVMRPVGRGRAMRVLIIAAAPVILALGFYLYLLLHLPQTSNKVQVLALTHRPDLLRIPEIIGILILVAIIAGVRQTKISFGKPQVIFTVSFALLPFLVFNQQIITGRSIQPFHYEVLIANYVVLLACLLWATMEVTLPFQTRYSLDVRNDEMVPVLLRLREQAKPDGTWEGLRDHGKAPALVFSPQYGISTLLPTWAPQGSLLAPGSVSFQSLSESERKERLYEHFYYCGKGVEYLRELLNDRTDDHFLTHFVKSTIFGSERDVPFLSRDFQSIRQYEIEQEVSAYEVFSTSFSRDEALKHPLGYAVTLSDVKFDFSHIDLWYVRDGGARVGSYTLYSLKPREWKNTDPSSHGVNEVIGNPLGAR